ncbi:hypothetical protein HOG48_02325 [Candidatus Peregrinibacteria bacterium]|mgnify:CR=1 FL=1|nr:hypothetical protein [Candidatus Peregrinibacteria bacterium]
MVYVDENQLLEFLRQARDSFELGDYETAYRSAQSALNLDETNSFANRVIKKSAKQIRRIRKRELKKREKALRPLWKSAAYEKLLKEYEALNKFYPNYPPLLLKIAKLKNLNKKQKEQTSTEYKKDIKSKIKSLHKEGKYMEAISGIEQIRPYFEGESWPEKLNQKIKHDYVVTQLRLRKELLENRQYEELYRFLTKLYKIFPEPRIKRHMNRAENLIWENRKYENRVFIEDSLDLINSLYADGKYEESMQVCEELFEITGRSNFKARTFYARSHGANEKEMSKMIKSMMLEKNDALQKAYKKNPEEFVKI